MAVAIVPKSKEQKIINSDHSMFTMLYNYVSFYVKILRNIVNYLIHIPYQ